MTTGPGDVSLWLSRCLADAPHLRACRDLGRGSGCRVWACEGDDARLILKLYSPGLDDYSRLGPVDTARKHALALQELPALGVPTPRYLGFAAAGEEAALAMEWVETPRVTPADRLAAARVLARVHSVVPSALSADLADLVRRSTPNRGRLGEVPGEPPLTDLSLQHGDYFSVNLAAGDALRVLDWDLLAVGDPMWDLAMFLEADRDTTDPGAEISAYRAVRPFDQARLTWHRACWHDFWAKRDSQRK